MTLRGHIGILIVCLWLGVAVCGGGTSDLDWCESPPSSSEDYPTSASSPNGEYVARLEPSEAGLISEEPGYVVTHPAHIQVFARSDDGDDRLLWECDLVNVVAPKRAIVSDDGSWVATFDDVDDVSFGLIGTNAVTLYGSDGLISSHDYESIFQLTQEELEEHRMFKLGAQWRADGLEMFQTIDGRDLLCVPTALRNAFTRDMFPIDEWLCWDMATGERVVADEAMVTLLDEYGLQRARELLAATAPDSQRMSAIGFLDKLHHDEDRELIAAVLAGATEYGMSWSTGYYEVATVAKQTDVGVREIDWLRTVDGREGYVLDSSSGLRALAETRYRRWELEKEGDGTPAGRVFRSPPALGTILADVSAPTDMALDHGTLWVYLFAASVSAEDASPGEALRIVSFDFTGMTMAGMQMIVTQVSLNQVPPGDYWVKVVWDRSPPAKVLERGMWVTPPPLGPDETARFTNAEQVVVTVAAGKIAVIENLQCVDEMPE